MNHIDSFCAPHEIFALGLAMAIGDTPIVLLDGHGHSYMSDGVYSPRKLAKDIPNSSLVLLTDHNTIQHFYRLFRLYVTAARFRRPAPRLVPGIEITCRLDHITIHVIWLGGCTSVRLKELIDAQKDAYRLREHERIKLVESITSVSISTETYDRLCASRTPNWAFTYDYLRTLEESGHLPSGTSEMIRRGREAATEHLSPARLPTLDDVLELATASRALVFMCHVGDIASKLGPSRLDEIVEARPVLRLDLTERRSMCHRETTPTIAASVVLTKRVKDIAPLTGTDFHTRLPAPQLCSTEITPLLASSAVHALFSPEQPAILLLSFMPSYASLLGVDTIVANAHLFRRLCETNIGTWLQEAFSSPPESAEQRVALLICSLAIVRVTTAQAIARAAALNSSIAQIVEFLTKVYDHEVSSFAALPSPSSAGMLLGLADVCQRLGLGVLSHSALTTLTTNVPSSIVAAYSRHGTEIDCAEIVAGVCRVLQSASSTSWAHLQILWRRKTICSVYSSILRALIEQGEHRSGIVRAFAVEQAISLLSPMSTPETDLDHYYRNLVYDHLGATVILPEPTIDYADMLRKIPIELGSILGVEWNARQAYHHRLWLRMQFVGSQSACVPTEIMIKTERDFAIGRCYQWYSRGIKLAAETSPWASDGSFDRDLAMERLRSFGSINAVLLKEVLAWVGNGGKHE